MSDLAVLTETKIILVYWCVFPAGKFYRPFVSFYDGNIYIIFVFMFLFIIYNSLVFAYTRHLSINAVMSAGISESKNISSPVVG